MQKLIKAQPYIAAKLNPDYAFFHVNQQLSCSIIEIRLWSILLQKSSPNRSL